MHAHAHTPTAEPDMFTGNAAPDATGCTGNWLEFEGSVLRNAEVRNKPSADGLHSIPVVCLELLSTSPGSRKVCHVEQAFTDATRDQAEALAKLLCKRKTITVTAPIDGMRITFTNAISLTPHQEQ
jgi:hypothetical protein